MKKAKEYKFSTVREIGSVVTQKNLLFLVADFQKTLEALLAMNAVKKSIDKENCRPHAKVELASFIWIDDGKNDCKAIVISSPTDSLTIDKDFFHPQQ